MRENSSLQYKRFYRTMPIPASLVLLLLFFVPLFFTLSSAFITEEGISFSRVVGVFTDSYTQRIMLFTVFQATISTLASLLVALPGAFLIATYNFRAKRLILALSAIPFVIPSILVVLGFVIFFGNNGFLNRILMTLFNLNEPPLKILYSFPAIILAHTFYNFPIIMSLVSSYWEHMDGHCESASRTLGATKTRTFFSITLPRLLPAIISACSLVFLFCFNSFAIILVLGGGPQFTTMEVEIYRQARMMSNPGAASALSLFSIVVTTLLLLWYNASQKNLARSEIYRRDILRSEKRPASFVGRVLALFYTLFSLLFILGPIISVVVRSFMASPSRSASQEFSLRWYRQLLSLESATGHMGSALTALTNSFMIALVVATLTVPVALTLSVAVRRSQRKTSFYELFGMLPMTVSSVIIGLGYYLISSRFRAGLSLHYILVVLAHMVIAIPFVLRTILPEYRKIPLSYMHSSLTLGAGPLRTFLLIELPLLKGSLFTGAIFAFALSMGEFNATLTLANSSIVTLPIVMYRLIGSYNFQGACALGTILIAVSVIVFIVSELAKGGKYGQ